MNKTRLVQITDNILLFFCCLLVAARCQINEAFGSALRVAGPLPTAGIGAAEIPAMVILSALTVVAAVVWFVIHIACGCFAWRKTMLVIPALLIIAGGLAGKDTGNRHTAEITGFVLTAQLVLALLLVQLLDRSWKQRLLLCVIAATGVTFAYRCWEQYHYEIPMTIEMFERDPQSFLAGQQLEPGTYQAQQFINRLKSRDVGGYFAISNTAASFFILSGMATLALLFCRGKSFPDNHIKQSAGTRRNRKHNIASPPPEPKDTAANPLPLLLIVGVLALAIQAAGMFITQSKGGIVASLACLTLLAVLWYKRNFFRSHWRGALITAVILVLTVVIIITAYGLTFERLPTNSMWIRWQYWQATGGMIADHWFAGVGPGNFGTWYPRYMDAGAPEVVKDPHCFWLALWSQWGLLGIVGFCAGLWAVARRLAAPAADDPTNDKSAETATDTKQAESQQGSPPQTLGIIAWGMALAIGIVAVRLLVSDLTGLSRIERNSVHLISFIVPTLIWLIAFVLLQLALLTPHTTSDQKENNLPLLILTCGLLGFLLHSSIDFGIFRPGVGTCFFALVAVAVAMRRRNDDMRIAPLNTNTPLRILIPIGLIIVLVVMFYKTVFPICAEQYHLKQAESYALQAHQYTGSEPQNTMFTSRYDEYVKQAEYHARQAISKYPDNPQGDYFLGRLYFLRWHRTHQKEDYLLDNAIFNFKIAGYRDESNYKYYRRLSEVYQAAALRYPDDKVWLKKALESAAKAIERYPTKSEMLIEYGRLLLTDNRPADALLVFERALQSEHAFLDQQRRMYPDKVELHPRLKPELRRWTEHKVRQLKQNL
ncbi:MAG: O-antigen ligase family protein [Sedimentisphaerales bacterium]|nr:O-antigen ligase family protein [Sedimentisphaerales bacterium]